MIADDVWRKDLLDSLRRTNPTMSDGERGRVAEELLQVASAAGLRMRRDRLAGAVATLRADLNRRGAHGAYPKSKWVKLRRLEAELASVKP